MQHHANFVKIGQSVAEINRYFCDFEHGGRRNGLSKCRNFNGPSAHSQGYRWFSMGLDKVLQCINVCQLSYDVY